MKFYYYFSILKGIFFFGEIKKGSRN